MCFVSDYFDFCSLRAMTQQSIVHLVVNLKVFTINKSVIDSLIKMRTSAIYSGRHCYLSTKIKIQIPDPIHREPNWRASGHTN